MDLLDQALQQPVGIHTPRSDSDNITISQDSAGGRGTSRQYALRRLRKDRPDLHAEVLAGRLSAHGAMVAAGIHPPTITLRVDSAEKIADTLRRKLDPQVLADVAARLAGDPR